MSHALHHLDLVIEDGTVQTRFRCAAAPDASCRRRPPDHEDRESWTDAEATETGHPCWAVEWASIGIDEALTGDDCHLGSVPVQIGYDECVIIEPARPHPMLEGLTAQEPTDAEVEAAKQAADDHSIDVRHYRDGEIRWEGCSACDLEIADYDEQERHTAREALRAAARARQEGQR